jgi:prolyl-tRNA synthetase
LACSFRAVAADTGSIGGTGSHEFHVLADSGEDAIAFCPDSDYAANVELAEGLAPASPRDSHAEQMKKVATPGKTRCEDVAALLRAAPDEDRQGHCRHARRAVFPSAHSRRPHPQ